MDPTLLFLIIAIVTVYAIFVYIVHQRVYGNPDQGESREIVAKPKSTLNGTSVEETDEGKLWLQIVAKGCPDCGSEEFSEGPQGGMMTNIECRNGHRFNVSAMLGIAYRI